MTDWTALSEELELWRRTGQTATFWWRDDDSEHQDPGIDSLLALRRKLGIPLALAAVPRATDQRFADAVASETGVRVLQHGYAHHNHAPVGEKKCELSGNREKRELFDELMVGQNRLRGLFGDDFLPVLVPPWNRIHDAWIHELPKLGYRGLSRATPRPMGYAVTGLSLVNVHVDIIDWRGSRRFVGAERALQQLLRHLQARREGEADSREPTGLLTHHLVEDNECWMFLDELISRTAGHPVRWLDAQQLF
ncbi:MAG: polysaccharide deacetylase family protein [Gammaproteobacteria bacterium]|nr:polysaccharide deacetylase family protein [Gammaproteobacteria bacterium]